MVEKNGEYFIENEEAAEVLRNQHRLISEDLESLKSQEDEIKTLEDDHCKKLFGLGAVFGRKNFRKKLENIKMQISDTDRKFEHNIEEALTMMENIREAADVRNFLLLSGLVSPEEAETLSSQEIYDILMPHLKKIQKTQTEGEKINEYLRAGYITVEQAESEKVDEYIARIDAEIARTKEKKYNKGEKLNPINLCFVRRTNIIPEVIDGHVYVQTPFSSMDDPMNPHFPRTSSHWSVNHAAEDPGVYGKYGTDITILCEGDKFILENGLPKRICWEDAYWLHDIVLPAGSKLFIKIGQMTAEQIDAIEKAGVHVIVEQGDIKPIQIENIVADWGYSSIEIASKLQDFANDNGIEFGTHEDEPADIAVRSANWIISLIQEAEREKTQSAYQDAINEYNDGILKIHSTIGRNALFLEQARKIERLLGPIIEDFKQRLSSGNGDSA